MQKLATHGMTSIEDPKQSNFDLIPNPPPKHKRNPLHLSRNLPISYKGRQEGKTTAIALNAIAMAINNPYTWITLIDHYRETPSGDDNLYRTVKYICDKLGLEQMFFKRVLINKKGYYISFGDPK